jgi:hypothetical protein
MRKTILCLMLLVGPATAQVSGGSNIGLAQYPAPNCTRPQNAGEAPQRPVSDTDKDAVNSYNANVKKYNGDIAGYNTAIRAFNDCMRVYVENGNADMLRIKQGLDAAVTVANTKP